MRVIKEPEVVYYGATGSAECEPECLDESSSCGAGGGLFGGDDSDDSDSEDDSEDDSGDDDDDDEEKCVQTNKSRKPNVEAAMVSVVERTKPVCVCGQNLSKYQVQSACSYTSSSVRCNGCNKLIVGKEESVYHCVAGKIWRHRDGYNLCIECGDKQLRFDELRGLLDEDEDYVLERNEDYPVRVTLQYYKATDNGAVNKEIMDDLVKQLEASQKQADFMGSLVTEYDTNRPTEWYGKPQDDIKVDFDPVPLPMPVVDGDGSGQIRAALEKHCGKDWKVYLQNFENEEVMDADLDGISGDALDGIS